MRPELDARVLAFVEDRFYGWGTGSSTLITSRVVSEKTGECVVEVVSDEEGSDKDDLRFISFGLITYRITYDEADEDSMQIIDSPETDFFGINIYEDTLDTDKEIAVHIYGLLEQEFENLTDEDESVTINNVVEVEKVADPYLKSKLQGLLHSK